MTTPRTMSLVMISNFGRADGGRETWAYQFLPRLLARDPDLHLEIHGLRAEDEPDNEPALMAAFAKTDRVRASCYFHRANRSTVPLSLRMLGAMSRQRGTGEPRDLVLCVGSFVDLLCALVAPAFRRSPKAAWLRTIYLDEKAHRIPGWLRPIARRIETTVLRRADLLIANGDDTAAHYRARGLTVEVIKNAVDLDRWRMPPPRLEEPIQVAFIGRLVAVKGAAEFLEVCDRLGGPHQNRFRFHAVGEGPYARQAEDLQAQGKVIYHGAVANDLMPALLGEMDVCVALTFVSQEGGQENGGSGVSNALLEQMAAGRLCLCWDNAAFRQVLDDDSCYFVPQGDLEGLTAALERIANDPPEARIRAMAGASLSQHYGIDAHMSRFAQIAAPWIAKG